MYSTRYETAFAWHPSGPSCRVTQQSIGLGKERSSSCFSISTAAPNFVVSHSYRAALAANTSADSPLIEHFSRILSAKWARTCWPARHRTDWMALGANQFDAGAMGAQLLPALRPLGSDTGNLYRMRCVNSFEHGVRNSRLSQPERDAHRPRKRTSRRRDRPGTLRAASDRIGFRFRGQG